MLNVGGHVRALLATAVIGTLGGNVALLSQPASVAADPVPTPSTTVTSVAPTTVPLPELAPAAFARVQDAGGLAVAGGGTCPADSLELSFDDPGPGWASGAFVSPLGPAPSEWSTTVNGIVRCAGSHHAYLGFIALRSTAGWDVELVPDVDLSHPEPAKPKPVSHDRDDDPAKNKPDKAPKPKAAPATGPIVGKVDGPEIEGYARYEGQATCDPAAKPGTLALRNRLLSRYPVTSSSGISRGCDVGGKSEHKEGRAFDWGANVGNGAQRAAVEDFLRFLFATDSYGHQHALARRMGVMYVIWNQQIWHAYRADLGWQPYSGSSPHTDHVHISLSWAGARAETSYYSGTVVKGLPDLAGGGVTGRSGRRASGPTTSTTVRPPRQRWQGTTTTTTPGDGARDGRRRHDGDGPRWRPPTPSTTTTVPTTPTTPTSTTSTTAAPAG